MGNFVRFQDSVNLTPLEVPQEVKDYYQSAAENGLTSVKPLRVRIAATHAGKVTRNNGFYLPAKMLNGASTFTDQYNKPIQVHHHSTEDPIGRVVGASYVDISSTVRDSVKDSTFEPDNQSLQDFVDDKMSFSDSVNFANSYIINDLKLSNDPNYEGLGYIEIVAEITDPGAIQKVLDRRYLTGSVGATTNQAVCSVCKKDWASEGKCEHRPGKVYDGAKCVIVAGDLSYDEYSFVNKPADRHSRVIEVNVDGIQDFVTCDEDFSLNTIMLVVDKNDHSKEENEMTFKDALAFAQAQDRFKDAENLLDTVKGIIDSNEDLTEEKLISLLDETYKAPEQTEEVSDEDSSSEETTQDSESLTEEKVVKLVADAVAAALQAEKEQAQAAQQEEDEKKKFEDAVEEATATLKAANDKLQTLLDSARKEIRYLHADISTLTDSLADSVSNVRKAHVNHILDMQKLTGEEADVEIFTNSLNEKTTDELVATLEDFTSKVDMQKIVDNLNSGLTNANPTEQVEDPTLKDEDQDANKDQTVQLSDFQRENLKLQWLQVRTREGKEIADKWLAEVCTTLKVEPTEVL